MDASIVRRRDCNSRDDICICANPIQDWKIQASRTAGRPFETRLRHLADMLVVDARMSRGCVGHRQHAARDFVTIMFIADGQEDTSIGSQPLRFQRGDIVVWNSRQANLRFEVTQALHKLMIFLPSKRVRHLWPELISPAILRLPQQHALAPFLAAYFNVFLDQLDTLADPDASNAACLGADLVARAADAQSERCPDDRRALTLQSAIRYLEANLRDPDLTPDRVAEHFGVSTRYLQILFAKENMTASGWIRQRRLDACRDALQCKSRHQTITEIAFAWGFNDPSHFTRLFRQRFGIAPTAYARRHLAT